MPALPIIERIALAIKAALESITEAAGYHADVSQVVRPVHTGQDYAPLHRSIELLQGDPERDEESDVAGNPARIAWAQPFHLGLLLRPGDRAETPADQLSNMFLADVIRAMYADPTFGGLALDTEITGIAFFPQEATWEGLTATFTVTYRTAENDAAQL